jgi:hypothetical protein
MLFAKARQRYRAAPRDYSLREPKQRHEGIALSRHLGEGAMIYKHACALGWEGIVSKRLGSLSRWPFGSLAEDQEPRCTGGAAARRGRLGLMAGRRFPHGGLVRHSRRSYQPHLQW